MLDAINFASRAVARTTNAVNHTSNVADMKAIIMDALDEVPRIWQLHSCEDDGRDLIVRFISHNGTLAQYHIDQRFKGSICERLGADGQEVVGFITTGFKYEDVIRLFKYIMQYARLDTLQKARTPQSSKDVPAEQKPVVSYAPPMYNNLTYFKKV